MYHLGSDAFWPAWVEFTESAVPVPVAANPRLVLVARDFQERTESAFEFLTQDGAPITLIRVTLYEDQDERRFPTSRIHSPVRRSAGRYAGDSRRS